MRRPHPYGGYPPLNELDEDPRPHPRGCRNGWLDVDVMCPVCEARADAEAEEEEA